MNVSVPYFLLCLQNTICVFMFVLMVRNNEEKIASQILVFLLFRKNIFDFFKLIQIDCLKSEVVVIKTLFTRKSFKQQIRNIEFEENIPT